MLHLQYIALLVALGAIFGLADRVSGGLIPEEKRNISADAIGAIIALGGVVLVEFNLLWAAVAWFIWRNPKWKIRDHGGIAPQKTEDVFYLLLRHQLATVTMVFFVLIYNGFDFPLGYNVVTVATFTFLWTLVATLLGIFNGLQVKGGKNSNGMVEILRGITFGVMLFCVTKFA